MSNLPDNEKTLQEQCYGTCWGAEQRIMELEYHIHKLVTRLEAAEGMRDALLVSLTRAFTQGYQRGHEATCEGGFVCIVPEDEKSYFIEDMQLAFDEGCFPELLKALAAFDAAGKETLCP